MNEKKKTQPNDLGSDRGGKSGRVSEKPSGAVTHGKGPARRGWEEQCLTQGTASAKASGVSSVY